MKRLWIFLFVCFLFVPLNTSASPWTKDPGKYSVLLGAYGIFSEANFALNTFDGNYYSITSYVEGEVGLPGGFGITAHIPFVSAWHNNEQVTYQAAGMGDAMLKLQWTPRSLEEKLNFTMTLHIDAKIPMYDAGSYQNDANLIQQGVANQYPLLGDGQVDLLFGLSGGNYWEVGAWTPFVSVMLGYIYRSDWFIGQGFPGGAVRFLPNLYFRTRGGFEWKWLSVIVGVEGNIPLGTETRAITEGQIMLETTVSFKVRSNISLFVSGYIGVWAVNTAVPYLASVGLSFEG
jgi:hypothetical protein